MRRNDLFQGLAQSVLCRAVRDFVFVWNRFSDLAYFLVKEWHAPPQIVRPGSFVGLDKDISAPPGLLVEVLHACHWIPVPRLCVNRCSDFFVIPLWPCPRDNSLELLKIKGTGIAVVTLFHRHGTTLEQ